MTDNNTKRVFKVFIMMEKHFAYKISHQAKGPGFSQLSFDAHNIIDLLNHISQSECHGIYWIFRQIDDHREEAVSIIDCEKQRIYFYNSGEFETVSHFINQLNQQGSVS